VGVLQEIQNYEVYLANRIATVVQFVMVETKRVKLVSTVSNAPTTVALPGGTHVFTNRIHATFNVFVFIEILDSNNKKLIDILCILNELSVSIY